MQKIFFIFIFVGFLLNTVVFGDNNIFNFKKSHLDLDQDDDGITDIKEGLVCKTSNLLPINTDGTFEALKNVARSDWFNSNVTGAGWYNGNGTADSWKSPMPSGGSRYLGVWKGLADGVPSSPDGGVFAAAGSWYSGEELYTTIRGLSRGEKYNVIFYQVNAGVNGSTQKNTTERWKVTFGNQVLYSPSMKYKGAGKQKWEEVTLSFTATATSQRLSLKNGVSAIGYSSGRGILTYMGIDGIRVVPAGDAIEVCQGIDTDRDGIEDHLDLDSDGDGCFDALEGSRRFTRDDINNNGVLHGAKDSDGIPTIANGGQDIGASRNYTDSSACNTVTDSCVGYESLYVVGNASIVNSPLGGKEYQLTPDKGMQVGAVFGKEKVNLSKPFHTKIAIYLGTKDGNGADGISFMFQNDAKGLDAISSENIRKGGGTLGLDGLRNTFAIEFDTWSNGSWANDIGDDHTGITLSREGQAISPNDLSNLMPAYSLGNIEDGKYHQVEVLWDPTKKKIDYRFDGKLIKSIRVDLESRVGSSAYWGFIGSTGGYNNRQSACLQTKFERATPKLTAESAAVFEKHSGIQNITFPIKSDIVLPDDIRVSYRITPKSATYGNDYNTESGVFTLPAGSMNTNVKLPIIIGDTTIEPDELFQIQFFSEEATFTDDGITTGTILNDDYDIKMRVVNPTTNFDWNSPVSTQIVNQPFNLTVLAYNHTLGIPVVDMDITKLMLGSTVLWTGSVKTGTEGIVPSIPIRISKAIKVADITVHGKYMEADYASMESDSFAVRPQNFKITLTAVPTPPSGLATAGDDFDFKIEALDALGAPSSGYNEVNGSTFALVHREANAACSTGSLTLTNINFINGEANQTVSYSEVGNLNFDVAEISGREFAEVDRSDTPNSSKRLISKDTDSITFIPGRLITTGHNVTTDRPDFVYYSASIDEGVNISATIEAQNSKGQVTKNYSAICGYSKDNNFAIQYDTDGDRSDKVFRWFDMINDLNNSTAPNPLSGVAQLPVDDSTFANGKAPVSMKFNLGRSPTKAMEPLLFKITALSAFDITTLTVTPYSKDIPFYYGRLYAPDYPVAGNLLTATLYHEVYCKNCDQSIFTEAQNRESVDNVYWYITNGEDGFTNQDVLSGASITAVGATTISLEADDLPHSNVVTYKPDSWLRYNQFNSSSPLDSFKVSFSSTRPQWAGAGELGKTVDMNVANTRGVQKMDW